MSEELDKRPEGEISYRATYEDGRIVKLEEVRLHGTCWEDWLFTYDDKGRLKQTENRWHALDGGDPKVLRVTAKTFNDAGLPVQLDYARATIAHDGKEIPGLQRKLEFSYDAKGRFSSSRIASSNGTLLCSIRISYADSGEFERLELYDKDGKLKKKTKTGIKDRNTKRSVEYQIKRELRQVAEIDL